MNSGGGVNLPQDAGRRRRTRREGAERPGRKAWRRQWQPTCLRVEPSASLRVPSAVRQEVMSDTATQQEVNRNTCEHLLICRVGLHSGRDRDLLHYLVGFGRTSCRRTDTRANQQRIIVSVIDYLSCSVTMNIKLLSGQRNCETSSSMFLVCVVQTETTDPDRTNRTKPNQQNQTLYNL